jgi:hypothetical protein
VGQLIAESVRLYGRKFWPSLALGVPAAAAGIATATIPGWWRLVWVLTGGALLATVSYVAACAIAAGTRPRPRALAVAILVGWLVLLPVPFLYSLFILPAAAWLGMFGLSVPAAALESLGPLAALRRGFQLGRADPVHAIGSLAALTIVGLVTTFMLFFLLRGQGQAALQVAAFLAVLVISPVLFLGGALLYFDQRARVRS